MMVFVMVVFVFVSKLLDLIEEGSHSVFVFSEQGSDDMFVWLLSFLWLGE